MMAYIDGDTAPCVIRCAWVTTTGAEVTAYVCSDSPDQFCTDPDEATVFLSDADARRHIDAMRDRRAAWCEVVAADEVTP